MKRIFAIFSIALLAFAACEGTEDTNVNGGDNNLPNDNDNNKPHITISKTEISVGSGVAMGFIRYELVNPEEGLTVDATADVNWITDVDFKNMGKIGFKTQSNPDADSRVGVITVTYGETSIDVTITQEGSPQPVNITVEAPMLTGHYYGLQGGLYNFYLAFTDKGMSAYEPLPNHNYFNVPNAWYYIVDLYLDKPAENKEGEPIIVPNGTYGFDEVSQGWPNMFGHEFSWLQQNDAYGNSGSQTLFDDGELVVEDGKVTLTVKMTIKGTEETHTVTYEGDYELVDMTGIKYQ